MTVIEVLVAGDRDAAIELRARRRAGGGHARPRPAARSRRRRREGFATLETILTLKPDTKVIVASGHGARESALNGDRARRL